MVTLGLPATLKRTRWTSSHAPSSTQPPPAPARWRRRSQSRSARCAAIQAQGYFVWLAVAGLLNSALSVFYYGRVLKVMFFDPAPSSTAPVGAGVGASAPPALAVGGLGYGRATAIALVAVTIVALGVYPQPVLGAIQSAASHFLIAGA